MIPSFAVVGRSNKGKSSIVATLIENEAVAVAPTPRTTQKTQAFPYKIGNETLFTIYDTPGFEEAPAVLEWLKSEPTGAHERRARVQAFLQTFAGTDRFRFERELLKPILDGAAILYVIDCSHPFRANFEAEFEILQWTGEPSIALLNQIGGLDFEAEWRRALQQYFKKVKAFNAHSAWLSDRVQLLETLKLLSDDNGEGLQKAIDALQRQEGRRTDQSVDLILDLIESSLRFELKLNENETYDEAAHSAAFLDELRLKEIKARKRLAALYGFQNLKVDVDADVLTGEGDLFSKATWELLGLSRSKLIMAGTAAGAAAGTGIDAMVGGASFLMGTGIGAVLGGASSTWLAFSDPEFAGFKLSSRKRTIGPYPNPNFPWILLDRQLAFLQAVRSRTHARRDELHVPPSASGKTGVSDSFDRGTVARMGAAFQGLRRGLLRDTARQTLKSIISARLGDGFKR